MAYMRVNFFSETLGMSVAMEAIVPQYTSGQISIGGTNQKGPYQTLYLLHGMSDDQTVWQRRTSIERYVSGKPLAVVMPSTELGWYTDMACGNRWWTFVSEELIRISRRFFPLSDKREDTFAAGLSMGGYGALKLGLRAADTFGAVATLSGAMDIAEVCKERSAASDGDGFWRWIFGDPDKVCGSDNDLFALAEKRAKEGNMPKVFQWCGTEDFLYQSNVKMKAHLTKLGYDLTYGEGAGDHSWQYWDEQIQNVLKWLPLKK